MKNITFQLLRKNANKVANLGEEIFLDGNMLVNGKKPAISENTLEFLLPDSLTSSLCVNIDKGLEVWVVAGMLVQYLETLTDSVVVREANKPIGMIGGKEIIKGVFDDPSHSFFYKNKVEDIMDTNLIQVTKHHTLNELLSIWKETRRAFAIIPNELYDYSAISAKKILEVGTRCKTDMIISDIPKKKTITFKKDDTVKDIINSMFENKTRKLLLEDSYLYINDRIIIETIAEDLKFLTDTYDFLDIPANTFKLEEAKVVSENLTIPEVSKILFEMAHPYVIYQDQVVSPWDICTTLSSENLIDYERC